MPYIVLASKLAFQKTRADDPKVPDGPEVIVVKGGLVPDWVSTFQVSALTSAGLLAWANEPEAVVVPEGVPQVRLPEQPVILPSDPAGVPPVVGDLIVDVPDDRRDETMVDVPSVTEPTPAVAPLPELPKASDSKDVWEQFATHPRIGLSLAEAEAMTKQNLMAEVKSRHAAAQ